MINLSRILPSLEVTLRLWYEANNMSRTAVMYIEIGCFLCCICGWILICSTLPTEYWNFSEVGDAVLTTVNYYSNLWMDCVSDTTGVSDCKYYPSLMALPGKDQLNTRILTINYISILCK